MCDVYTCPNKDHPKRSMGKHPYKAKRTTISVTGRGSTEVTYMMCDDCESIMRTGKCMECNKSGKQSCNRCVKRNRGIPRFKPKFDRNRSVIRKRTNIFDMRKRGGRGW